jgi:hypothetical protein
MKTTTKKSEKKGVILTIGLVFVSLCIKAESIGGFFNGVVKDLSKDGGVGLYIIGGILSFGAILLIINKIASRYVKEDDANQKNIHPISHRDRHHHKVIKKSA